jgi:methylthioribulose-1-phosphate dehydratase
MVVFCSTLNERIKELTNFGFLIYKHGIYAWGDSIFEAKRHLETWEFLLEAELTLSKI